ncbi:MAG: TetR/AcrR family transcriptional regulator [Deltaproteobacteria bacterium]|nr:TetR/AcrR family transcriptional regulator [Deltaproteobacteria bacterium]
MTTPPTTTASVDKKSRRARRPDDGRLVRGRKSRAKIRAAFRTLFREHGFDATTLRMIGERAGMGASSIYRHIRSKEELLVEDLAELQNEAWKKFRAACPRRLPARERLRRFLDAEHALLAQDRDFTVVMLRATTHPEARVAKRVLALQDRTIGLVAEILQSARSRGELRKDADVLAAARTVLHVTNGARIAWANGQLDAEECREAIAAAVELLFAGIAAPAKNAR